jgi:aldehyde:ferredoxin oxidoreductase
MAKKTSVYGYAGKILRVNLSNGEISTGSTLQYAKDWLGASGIAIKMLYDELRPWVTPYEPANRLIFGSGALAGTTAPAASKMNISTLGPMTGGWASGLSDSYFGGQLKYAGYDAVVVEGKAHQPVYLWIHDDRVEIRDASHLWGKTTWDTLEIIRKDLGDPTLHTVSIGPAGENLVRGACIIQDKGRSFGRCGSGAVMGAKNLKALVAKGTGSIQVADPKRFMKLVEELRKRILATECSKTMQKYGTLFFMAGKQKVCGMCYKNFQDLRLPDDLAEAIDPMKTVDRYRVGRSSFPGCPIGCGQVVRFTDGPYAGLTTTNNQWEVVANLQGRFAIREPQFMFKVAAYSDQMGLDWDLAAGAIGWAMECYQRGIINEKDTDGLKLNWGDAGVVLELMRKTVFREGFGNILAEGSARAADLIGRDSSYYALHIKDQDLYETCRGDIGWALGTAVSTRGGGHTTGAPVWGAMAGVDPNRFVEICGVEGANKPQVYEGKAKVVAYTEALSRIANSLGICLFNTTWFDPDHLGLPEMAGLYSAATGWHVSIEDLKKIAERQLNLEKAFNLRHTRFGRKDDLPTPRDMSEPIPSGALAGWKWDEDKYNRMLDEYYDLHGWDRETGFPKRETLVNLGLERVADDLEKIGKLG